jgi:hypothetical protein
MKKIVHYQGQPALPVIKGYSAFVWPTDHPSEQVSNTKCVQTSAVVWTDGENPPTFETMNSRYVPVVSKGKDNAP